MWTSSFHDSKNLDVQLDAHRLFGGFLRLFMRVESKPDTVGAELVICVAGFYSDRLMSLQFCGEDGCPRTTERIQDPASRLADLHKIPHELQRLFRDVKAVLWICVPEHPRQTSDRAVHRHSFFAAPHHKFALLTEPALLRSAAHLVPYHDSAPDPSRPLERVGDARQLPPVDEQTDRRAVLADLPRFKEPFRHPVRPAALILLIADEIRQSFFAAHAAVLLISRPVSLVLAPSAGRVGRVGDERVEAVRLEMGEHPHCVAVQDRPAVPAAVLDG